MTAVTPRAIGLGLILMVVHTIWLIYEELALQHIGIPTFFTLVPTVIGLLFTLMLLNSLFRRLLPKAVLAPGELMTIFVMTTLGAIVTARNLLHYLFAVVLWPLARPGETGGDATLAAHSPLLAPRDPGVVSRYFEGTRDFWAIFRPENLVPWLLPLAFWAVFFFLLLWTMLCLASLVRRPWMDEERVPFPLVDLPVTMARDNHVGALFSNRLLVLGFVLTAILLSVNYVASLYPSVPGVKLAERDIGTEWIVVAPWLSVNPLLTVWWPYAIGLCYLIPLDVSFSCWFFFLAIRLVSLAVTMAGWRDVGSVHNMEQFPYFGNAAEGAWLGMFATVLWNARRFLKRVHQIDDRAEAISYNAALRGAAMGYFALVALGVAVGMRLPVAALAFALYFLAIVVMTRMYAQVAMPLFAMAFFSFTSWTTMFVGTASLTRPEATSLTSFYWFDRTYEQLPMAHHLEGLVVADRLGQSRRAMWRVMVLACAVAIPLGMLTLLQIFYDRGASSARVAGDANWLAGFVWARFNQWTGSPKPLELAPLARGAVSAALVLLLSWARNRWIGFPLHPIGYLFSSSFALEWGMWNILFVTWGIKALVVRYGGLSLYRRSVPFFLGMALGDAVTRFFWGIGLSLAGITGASPY